MISFFSQRKPLIVGVLAIVIVLGLAACQGVATSLEPASAPDGPLSLSLSTYATGLVEPVSIAHAGDGRLFVVERRGMIRIVDTNGTVLGTPFLDIRGRVDDSDSEEGLLGLTFHPDYDTNGYFYVNYINTSGTRRTRISQFSVTGNPDVADPSSEEILLTINQPSWNHNAGGMNFGPDGFLYIPMGDGGGSGDTANNAQNTTNLLGAIVRIDVDSGPGASPDCDGIGTGNYTIPNDNPYIDGAGGDCDEIWAHGLRNPWRSTFDRVTGDLFIGDVGQGSWEEIDFQPASSSGGENYGWRCYEGNNVFNNSGCGPMSNYDFPIFVYANGADCAVTGGYIYRGSQYPNMYGHYLLADYCSGVFWDLFPAGGGTWNATEHNNLMDFGYTTFGEGADGELYVARSNGTIYHIEDAVALTATPTNTSMPSTNTPTPTPTDIPSTNTPTPTSVPGTFTPTPTSVPGTFTPTPTNTATATNTATPTATATINPNLTPEQWLPILQEDGE